MQNWTITAEQSLQFDIELMRRYCRIVGNHDDALLQLLAAAAGKLIETETRLALTARTYSTTIEPRTRHVDLPRGPFGGVVSLDAINADDSTTELDADKLTHNGSNPGTLTLATDLPTNLSMQLSYTAGYTTLPQTLLLAILQLVSHWYEHREAVTADGAPKEIPIGYGTLIRSLDTMQDAVN